MDSDRLVCASALTHSCSNEISMCMCVDAAEIAVRGGCFLKKAPAFSLLCSPSARTHSHGMHTYWPYASRTPPRHIHRFWFSICCACVFCFISIRRIYEKKKLEKNNQTVHISCSVHVSSSHCSLSSIWSSSFSLLTRERVCVCACICFFFCSFLRR